MHLQSMKSQLMLKAWFKLVRQRMLSTPPKHAKRMCQIIGLKCRKLVEVESASVGRIVAACSFC